MKDYMQQISLLIITLYCIIEGVLSCGVSKPPNFILPGARYDDNKFKVLKRKERDLDMHSEFEGNTGNTKSKRDLNIYSEIQGNTNKGERDLNMYSEFEGNTNKGERDLNMYSDIEWNTGNAKSDRDLNAKSDSGEILETRDFIADMETQVNKGESVSEETNKAGQGKRMLDLISEAALYELHAESEHLQGRGAQGGWKNLILVKKKRDAHQYKDTGPVQTNHSR